jgi:hypothetical protein
VPHFCVARSVRLCAVAGVLPVAITLAACIAGISAVAAIVCVICSIIVSAGPVVPPLIDQWQRVRIVGKVLEKVDSVDDAVSLLQALAPPSWPAADASAGSAHKP